MSRQRFDVEIPDGIRLGFAQNSDGGMRGLLFDQRTSKLIGHAELFEPEEEEEENDDGFDTDHGDAEAPPERSEDYDAFVEALANCP